MITLGSLFDGAGTFPFAAQQYGVKPVWASEIEPFPVEVTKKRFPEMKHLGDITKINGADIEPVDIITFGSPCQGLSAAGKRAGLDDERSGLFMVAIRIIKEMRGKTHGEYPKIAIWENVPGAFSSNKGEDFRIVLEELCKIEGGNASVPRPPKRGGRPVWNDAGLILGDGYSIAWRVLDAQFWGVPQRRRRIFLVADFGGQCAGEILFEREGLSRNFAESRESWQGFTHSLACCSDAKVWDARGNGDGKTCSTITGDHNGSVTDYTALYVRERCGKEGDGKGCLVQENKTGAIACNNDQFIVVKGVDCFNQSLTGDKAMTMCAANGDYNHSPCVALFYGKEICGNNQPVFFFALDRSSFNQGMNAQFDIGIDDKGIAHTLVAKGPGAVAFGTVGFDGYNGDLTGDVSSTLGVNCGMSTGSNGIVLNDQGDNRLNCVIRAYGICSKESNAMKSANPHSGIYEAYTSRTLDGNGGNPGCNQGGIAVVCVDQGGGKSSCSISENVSPTLAFTHGGEPAVCVEGGTITVRRLTPTECGRLQGMPDWWCEDVPHSDTAEYKMWGNGMALPNVLYVMEGVVSLLSARQTDKSHCQVLNQGEKR